MAKQKQKTIIYIDGENAFYQIFDELKKQGLVKYREDLVKFDLVWLLAQTIKDMSGEFECRYYGSKLKEVSSTNKQLEKRAERMIDHKRRWAGYLSNQGVNFVSSGQMAIRDISSAKTKGHELVFEEKGVDVSIAVDMVSDAYEKSCTRLILWSNDTDLKPALLAVGKQELKAVYLTHKDRINDVLAGCADSTLMFSSDLIRQAYEHANKVE